MFSENFNELRKMIDESAEKIYSRFTGIPKLQNENKNIASNIKWKAKYFFITEQTTADEYANFMTTLIQNQDKYLILREKENWTPSGELIKIIEYLEKS